MIPSPDIIFRVLSLKHCMTHFNYLFCFLSTSLSSFFLISFLSLSFLNFYYHFHFSLSLFRSCLLLSILCHFFASIFCFLFFFWFDSFPPSHSFSFSFSFPLWSFSPLFHHLASKPQKLIPSVSEAPAIFLTYFVRTKNISSFNFFLFLLFGIKIRFCRKKILVVASCAKKC